MLITHMEPDGTVRLPEEVQPFFIPGDRIEVTQHQWHLGLWRGWVRPRRAAVDHVARIGRASEFERAANRLYHRAWQLQETDVETALYLSGYGVECRLKVLICQRHHVGGLERAAYEAAKELGQEFDILGSQGHNLEVLLRLTGLQPLLYQEPEIWEAFNQVNRWSVAWRYEVPPDIKRTAADHFAYLHTLMTWLEEKI
jgi:hypothetical protein